MGGPVALSAPACRHYGLTVAESVWRSVRPRPYAISLILTRRSHSAPFSTAWHLDLR